MLRVEVLALLVMLPALAHAETVEAAPTPVVNAAQSGESRSESAASPNAAQSAAPQLATIFARSTVMSDAQSAAVVAQFAEPQLGTDRPTSFTELSLFAQSATDRSSAPTLALDVAKPTRSARLLTESAVVLGGGVVLPFTAYAGFTALQSFVGFFGGFLSATIIGAVLAPIAVIVAGHLLGAEGGTGRSVIGALLGLVVGLLVGLPLATLPGAGYLVGLGLLWALPSVGTLIAFEWGRAEPPPTGAVVFRF